MRLAEPGERGGGGRAGRARGGGRAGRAWGWPSRASVGWPSRAMWSGEPGQDAGRMRVQDDLDDIRRVIGDPHELRVRRGNLATGEQRPLDPGQQPGPVLPADED